MLHARLNISHDMSALPDSVVALNASILVIDSLVSSLMIAMMSLNLRFMVAPCVQWGSVAAAPIWLVGYGQNRNNSNRSNVIEEGAVIEL